MKKILFCLQTMVFGGVEQELITILKQFNPDEYQLSVLLFYAQDEEMLARLPKNVQLICLNADKNYYCGNLKTLVKTRCKKGKFLSAAKLVVGRALGFPTGAIVHLNGLHAPQTEYDYAVCYHMHSPTCLRFVADKVQAKRKVAWIHNDFSTTGFAVAKYGKWLQKYDKVIAVSQRLNDEFMQRCPTCKEKTQVVHNIVDADEIAQKSLQVEDLDERFTADNGKKLVTVGRFVEQKGFDIAIDACKILQDKGVQHTWYAIGYGAEEENYRQRIVKAGLENTFILLGRKANPYPYMRLCDVYVQPSRHEGYPITLCEAKALKKAVVCTNFAGAEELVEEGKTGVVVQGFTPEAVAAAIEELLTTDKLDALQAQMQQQDVQNAFREIESVFIEE